MMARAATVKRASQVKKQADLGNIADLRAYGDARMGMLETQRWSWWTHWADLARYILPRRYRYLVTPSQWNRGSPINQNIIDSTGTIAARTLGNGMMSGITNPSRPWFRLTVPDEDLSEDDEVKLWLDEVMKRMQRVMASSNYYTAKAVQYHDLVVFGTAPMIIYEDADTTIRCFNPCAGEYYCAIGPEFSVDTLYRKFTMTVGQVVEEFGYDNCSDQVKSLWDSGGSSRDNEIIVCHACETNPEWVKDVGMERNVRQLFRFREYYWEQGASQDRILRYRGYNSQPFSCPRWDVTGNDAYGRSPAMDALGDIKQLQVETKRKAQAIDKMVNPPMLADVSMKNEPASLLPAAVTYVPRLDQSVGFRPVFQVIPPIGEMKDDIREVQARIMKVFFNDLFMMMAQLDAEAPNTQRTATEINARREEQLIQLGPVLERNENEGLGPDIARIFAIMWERGMLPKPPDILYGRLQIKIEYVSMLAEAQRSVATTAIEQLWRFGGGIAAVRPDVLDNLNSDESIKQYADYLRVSPKLMQDMAQVQAQRQARQQAQQQQAAMQNAAAAVQGAQALSQTELGGGQNALQAMLSGGPGGLQ